MAQKNLHGPGKGTIIAEDIDYSTISTNLKEINYTFYIHPFYLPMKSNAQSKFLKIFVSFFKGEKGEFSETD